MSWLNNNVKTRFKADFIEKKTNKIISNFFYRAVETK